MKFLRVEVDNWRPFQGQSEMDLAASESQPITLVFGKNGGGKTSLLTAIYWCLYGEADLEEGKSDQHLVNDHAVREAPATLSDPVRATVTLYAAHTAHGTMSLHRIERRKRAHVMHGAHIESPDSLIVERFAPPTAFRPGDDVAAVYSASRAHAERFEAELAQPVINSLLPKGLAKYFFYPGETLAFPFKDDKKSQDNLGEFLREVSGSSKFAPFAKLIDTAHKRLAEKSRLHAKADRATMTLQSEIEALERDQAEKEQLLPQISDELDAAVANRAAVIAQLDALSAFQVVLAEAETARQAQRAAEKAVEHAEQSLSDALRDAYLCVGSPIFDTVLQVFSQRQYPKDVSSALVAQMRDSMKCICDRDLDEEMLARIAQLSPADDAVAIRMIALASRASDLRGRNLDSGDVDKARVALNTAIQQRSDRIQQCDTAEARLTAAGAAHFAGVEADNLVTERTRKDDEIRSLQTTLADLKASIQRIQDSIESKEKAKQEAAPQIHKAAHQAEAIAKEMQGLLKAIADKQADVAREQLDKLIAENYVIYKNNISAKVDAEFRVKVYDDTGDEQIEKPVGDLSGSETALLTYAFAAAAARLIPQYQTLDKLLTTIPEFAEVENIPLVVDAPFAGLGPENKRRVMDLMARGFSQVVMFTEAADTDVLEEASEKIGAEHLVRFEGDMDADVESTFKWKDRTYTYASPSSEAARSTLECIKDGT